MRDRKGLIRRTPLLLEALCALAFASVFIAVFSFQRVAVFASRGRTPNRTAPPNLADSIDRAIGTWAHRVPWRALCFQRGLAAHLMLRRRNLATTMFYGARRDPDGHVVAHVWVRSGDTDVTGCENLKSYGVLAVFPARA